MADENPDIERLRRELAYYRKRVDELAGVQLKIEYTVPALRHELAQKRQGFALLSQLQQSVSAHRQISSIFEVTIGAINSTLGMDRTVVLSPSEHADHYRPTQWAGFRDEAAKALSATEIEFPAEFAQGNSHIIADALAMETPLIEQIRVAFGLPFFIAVPVKGDNGLIGIIVSGRVKEAKPLYPPLDRGDIDTFQAISGLISATVQNMRVAVLQETDRLKTEFFANISHEFRTPITLSIGPLDQLLTGRYGPLPEGARTQIDLVVRNQERLLGLVNQILDLAKLEAGKIVLRASPVADVNRLIRNRSEPFRTTGINRDVTLRLELDPSLEGVSLYLDLEKFDKLLFNLLSNACKFTKKGYIEVATTRRGDRFELTITDTGIGIEEDQLPYIFDRFRQADSGAAREYGGTGLGLALVKEVAKLHDGTVTVRSQEGHGSAFQVSFPLGSQHIDASTVVDFKDDGEFSDATSWQRRAIAAEENTNRTDIDQVNTCSDKGLDPLRPTILYAEDNVDLRKYVYDLLASSYNVYLAADGGEGWAIARRVRPDLIVTDFMMPRVSGREFLQLIRSAPQLKAIPVIFLTARAGAGARIETLELGADDYLTKPFDQGELLARIRNLLKSRSQERELEHLNSRLEAKIDEQMAELVRTGELKRFLPEPLVRKLMSGAISSQKPFQRRKITSLAIGLTDFADLVATLEAEDLAAIVNDFVREATATVMENGGIVDKILGETLFAMFGAPEEMPIDEQARAAVNAALQIRKSLPELSRKWRPFGVLNQMSVQAGINTGYCTVGAFGSELLSNYTAIGEPITIATRLRAAASKGSIFIGAAAYVLLNPDVLAEGPKTLSGSIHPLQYYEITAVMTEARGDGDQTLLRQRVEVGAMIAHFRIMSRLGSGGMGEVFLAEDQKLRRRVALKIAAPEVAHDSEMKERFFLEARSASALNHVNIAHIYEIGEFDGLTYIAMEFVDGTTLRNKIGGIPLDTCELLNIAVQIGSALQIAHYNGIIHRDIKPENVVITLGGDLKVLDFGLAKVVTNEKSNPAAQQQTGKMLTRPGLVMGTVHYMSPEQALGRQVDFRSDIFSLGVVVYEMATGRLPFSGVTTNETIDLIVHSEPASIALFNAGLPIEVDYVIRKCLQKSPSSRYQSTNDLVVDLRNAHRAAVT
jgi:signal transduction histidine kinase/class 3 adenylate cyclase